MTIDEYSYLKLCDKNSDKILQRIICPYCGLVYSHKESVQLAILDNCEDEVIITCKKCSNKMIVHSIVTEYRLWAKKYEEVGE